MRKVDINILNLSKRKQVEIIRKETQDYGELRILSYIEDLKHDYFGTYCFYKNVLLFPELFPKYLDLFPNNVF